MHVIPIAASQTNYTTFNSKRSLYYLSKAEFYESKKKKLAEQKANAALKRVTATIAGAASLGAMPFVDAKTILSSFGITYCNPKDSNVNIATGYNGGFYSVKSPIKLDKPQAEEFVAGALYDKVGALGGITNYVGMVQDIKRQDLIQKGLKIHTYEMNNSVTPEQATIAARFLKKETKQPIAKEDLFFIDDEAIYYNKYNRTAYSVNIYHKTDVQRKSSFRTCQFEVNEKGHVIGYTTTQNDFYLRKNIETKYMEQQTPQVEIPPVIDRYSDNKDYAEAYRFGNSKPSAKQKISTPRVLEHLENKIGVDSPKEQDIQYIKLLNNKGETKYRFGYYDSSIGTSFIYDEDGMFLGQMEYNKDGYGNIISCSSF